MSSSQLEMSQFSNNEKLDSILSNISIKQSVMLQKNNKNKEGKNGQKMFAENLITKGQSIISKSIGNSNLMHKCSAIRPSEILINVNNDSKVEIREEYDCKNRKIINIIVDDKTSVVEIVKVGKAIMNFDKIRKSNEAIMKDIKKDTKKISIVKSYKSIEEYKKKIDEKLAKLKK